MKITKIHSTKRIALLIFALTISANLYAQTDNVRLIRGFVYESENHSKIPYANISILAVEDSSLLSGTTANASGEFSIHVDSAGIYILRAASIGFQNLYQTVSVQSDSTTLVLGMVQETIQLDAISIIADKPIYSTEGESEIYNVKNDPSVQSKSLDQAMSNIPGVELNARGQVSYRGQYAVDIWKNGQPLNLTGDNLIMYLKSIPTSIVHRIEVIDNPSVRYQTGNIIINIVLKKDFTNNNFVMIGGSVDSSPEIIPWVSYVYSNNKITANIYANLGYDGNNFTSSGNRSLFINSDTSRTESYFGEALGGQTGTIVSANVSYKIDTTQTVSFFGELSFMKEKLTDDFDYQRQEFLFSPGIYDFEHTDTSSRNGSLMSIGFMYNKNFVNIKHKLNIVAYARDNNIFQTNKYARQFSSNVNNFQGQYDLETKKKIYNAEITYSIPFFTKGSLNFGINSKYYLFDKDRSDLLNQTIDYNRSYTEKTKTQNFGAFISENHSFGNLTTMIGIRANYDHLNVNYPKQKQQDLSINHIGVEPSLHLAYMTKTRHAFKINYTMRIGVPSAEQIAPLRKYDYDSYIVGAASLKPSYTHNFQTGWNKYYKSIGRFSVTGYWRSIHNDISPIALTCFDTLFGTIVNYSTYQNIGTSSATGIEINYLCNIKTLWRIQLYLNGYNYSYHSDVARQDPFNDHAICYSIRLHATANPTQWLTLYVNANYASSTIALQTKNYSHSSVDVGLSFDLFKHRLLAYISVEDLFDQNHLKSNTLNPYFLSYSYIKHATRYIMVGLTYRFGRMALNEMARTGDKFMKNK